MARPPVNEAGFVNVGLAIARRGVDVVGSEAYEAFVGSCHLKSDTSIK